MLATYALPTCYDFLKLVPVCFPQTCETCKPSLGLLWYVGIMNHVMSLSQKMPTHQVNVLFQAMSINKSVDTKGKNSQNIITLLTQVDLNCLRKVVSTISA